MAALDEWDPRRGRSGRPWQRLVELVCPPGSVCALCGGREGPILFGVRAGHPLGRTVDHIVPLAKGGHPTALWNLQPAHRRCNTIKENKARAQARRDAPKRKPRSRDW